MVVLVHRLRDECLWALDAKVCLVATTTEAFHVALTAGRLMREPEASALEMLVGTLRAALRSRAYCSITKPTVLVENQVHLYYAPLPETQQLPAVDRGHALAAWTKRISSLPNNFEFLGSPSLFTTSRPTHALYDEHLHHLASPEEAVRVHGSFVPLKMALLFSSEGGNAYLPASIPEHEALATSHTCCLLMMGIYRGRMASLVFPVETDHLRPYYEEFALNAGVLASPVLLACEDGDQAPRYVRFSRGERPNRRQFNVWLPALWRLQLFLGIRIGVSLDRKRTVTAKELLNELSVIEWPGNEGPDFVHDARGSLVINLGTRERALGFGLAHPFCPRIVLGDYGAQGHTPETLLSLALERALGSLEDTVTESMMALGCYLNAAMTHIDRRELLLLPDGVKARYKKFPATKPNPTIPPPAKRAKIEGDHNNEGEEEEIEAADDPDSNEPGGDGGYIYRPPSHVGLHTGHIEHMDFSSFYPTLIIQHAYSPDKYGLLPLALTRLLALRAQTGNVAFKLLANHCYGWLNAIAPALRSEVAQKGREILISARDYVNDLRDPTGQPVARVLYCVTDSMFVLANQMRPSSLAPMGASGSQESTETTMSDGEEETSDAGSQNEGLPHIDCRLGPLALETFLHEKHGVKMPISVKETLQFLVLGQRKHAIYGLRDDGSVMGKGLLYNGLRVPEIVRVMMDPLLAGLIFKVIGPIGGAPSFQALETLLAHHIGQMKDFLLQLRDKGERHEQAQLMSFSIKVNQKKLWPPPSSTEPSLNHTANLVARLCVRSAKSGTASLAIQSDLLPGVMTLRIKDVGDCIETADYFMRADPKLVTCDPTLLLNLLATEIYQLTAPLFTPNHDNLQTLINRTFNL